MNNGQMEQANIAIQGMEAVDNVLKSAGLWPSMDLEDKQGELSEDNK